MKFILPRWRSGSVFGESDKIAIEKMYDHYLLAFIKKDYDALRESFQAPFVVLDGGDMQALTSVDAVMAFYRKQLVALEQRNYDHAEITNTRDAGIALASTSPFGATGRTALC